MQETSPRVLSIQSHVVSGYVGNKSATFPLQILGFEVDAINSVQFSNHTGYGSWQGQVLNEDDLSSLTEGLSHNKLDFYSHLLTGYVGSPSFLMRIAQLVKHLRQVNPKLVYVCDPVMGDNGRMYVPEELLPIYRDNIIPLADIITPNQYEAERLTGINITNVEEAWQAMDQLHAKGPSTVVLSSTELGDDDFLLGLASSRLGGKHKKVTIKIPKLAATFTGTGDLFAALFMACMHRSGGDLQDAVEKTVCTLQAVLKRTFAHAQSLCGGGPLSKRALELQLIQSKNDIEHPQPSISAVCEYTQPSLNLPIKEMPLPLENGQHVILSARFNLTKHLLLH